MTVVRGAKTSRYFPVSFTPVGIGEFPMDVTVALPELLPIDGDLAALTAPQKRGLAAFLQNGCAQCHWGPRLTDDAFHVLRFPTGRQDHAPDQGREDGLLKLAASDLTASSPWSDSPSSAKIFCAASPLSSAKKPARPSP